MTKAELESAMASLPAKKQRLRESFDRLVACAPIPIPFTWDDLDSHISSLHSSIAVRFRQLQSLQATAPTTTNLVEHRGEEDQQPDVEHHGRDKGLGSNEEERGRAKRAPWNDEAEEAIEEFPGQEDDVKGEAIKASADHENDDDEEAMEASHGHGLGDDEENAKEAMKESSVDQSSREMEEEEENCPIPDFTGGGGSGAEEAAVRRDLVAASANMDASTLADMLCWGAKRSLRARCQFVPALLGAADPHALVVRAIRAFLVKTEHKSNKIWENCVALLICVGDLTTKPSVETLEQANRLAVDWKGMLGKPERCQDLGRLAIWGLFRFLVSYNITLEFDAHEIIPHFGNIPRSKKQSTIELCKCLGLIHMMTDSINRLIGNGQQFDALRLAHDLNLSDKYPPLLIMNDYIDKAKKTAQEILSKDNDSWESLNQAMKEQVNALILSWREVDECNIDPVHRKSIKTEITLLLHEYSHKRQTLSDSSSSTLGPHQQHKLQEQYQQQQHTPEEQQQKIQELQKERDEEHQHQPLEGHHQQLQNRQEAPEQEWSQQNRKRKRNHRREQLRRTKETRQHRFYKHPRLSRAGSFGHSPQDARAGNHNHPGQQFSGIHGDPLYPGLYNRCDSRPAY